MSDGGGRGVSARAIKVEKNKSPSPSLSLSLFSPLVSDYFPTLTNSLFPRGEGVGDNGGCRERRERDVGREGDHVFFFFFLNAFSFSIEGFRKTTRSSLFCSRLLASHAFFSLPLLRELE